ncbi:MAG: DUF3368 domain-containing protein [Verrucomicrobiia bacterium]
MLGELYQVVCIPTAVQQELQRVHSQLPSFLQVRHPTDTIAVQRLRSRVDEGEAEAIILAKELRADFVLMDEKIGRGVAAEEGLAVVGLLGVLVTAKAQGHIASVRQIIAQLDHEARFRVSTAVKQRALQQAGEE